MKRIFGIFVLIGGLASVSLAQKLDVAKVPASVKAAFAKRHPATKVNWEMEKVNYEAGFSLNGKEISEVYAKSGALLETEIEIKSSELPTPVLAKLRGMKIAEAARITKADGTLNYEAEVKGKDLLFDANGNPIKS
ncbi:hypothetical protein ACFOG5_13405 [Pedobacter fastidiosus]|uniref:Beta-lactamase-inhibitor-like, PepSY-like n=1 Tax=Pedobacter fastidiosus TaxID=2765361 RepID=A0ABR7KLM1_9SPHI|nr:hypothetical protein [Pedobacter fastidiosus]MBC6108974.1 hypothetical protein [Pedobacter fastidiosus]